MIAESFQYYVMIVIIHALIDNVGAFFLCDVWLRVVGFGGCDVK